MKNSKVKKKSQGIAFLDNAQHGFNIIELLIVVAIIGIVSAIAYPSYTNFIKNQTMTSTSTEIIATLQAARTEAIKRGVLVKVCFKAARNDTNCVDPQIGTNNPGVLNYIYAFVDANNDDQFNGGEDLIFTSAEFNNDVVLKQAANNNIGGNLSYSPKGGITFEESARNSAFIAICDDRAIDASSRLISIYATGRASQSLIHENSPVSCT